MTRVPHFQIPLRIADGSAVVVEQDSSDDVVGCVFSVLSYTTGSRIEMPEFGRPDFTFGQPGEDRLTPMRAAVARWEMRAQAVLGEDLNRLIEDFITALTAAVGAKEGA